jgi:hypothetical protein
MSVDRVRNPQNLPQKTRDAATTLESVCQAACSLAATPAPFGRGAGQALIERELAGLRERVNALTEGSGTLNAALQSPYRLMVVGPSQVGKSTLINVIAGHQVLPTTGVGDAKTLKETILTYSSASEQMLRVRYITRREANQRRFALERYLRNLPDVRPDFVKGWNEAEKPATTEESGVPSITSDEGDVAAAARATRELDRRYEVFIQQIKSVIYPEDRDQQLRTALASEDKATLTEARPVDWVDAWRMLLGQELVAGGRHATRWLPRLEVTAKLLGKTLEFKKSEIGTSEFRRAIERHTAEGLAFLVDRVELALPSENLAYLDVEDLPGVGNFKDPASDVARDVLSRAMRDRDLDGLLVVTRQNGLDSNTADLIAEAAVLKRVLQGETDLAIAITHVDQIASQRAQNLVDQGMPEDEQPEANVLLRQAGSEAATAQQTRLHELLRHESEDVDEPERTARIDRVLLRTRIFGIEASAAEAHCFNLTAKKRRAFATSLEGTGVPDLIDYFKAFAEIRHEQRLVRVVEQATRIHDALDSELVQMVHSNDVAEAQHLAAAAREAFVAALDRSRTLLSNRWTAIRERALANLELTSQAVLQEAGNTARKEATRRKRAIIRGCRATKNTGRLIHWKTMKAALLRGGAFDGAHHVDLPGDLAVALMPELLKGWRTLAADVESLLTSYATSTTQILKEMEGSVSEAAAAASIASGITFHDARAQLQANQAAAVTLLLSNVEGLTKDVQQRLRTKLNNHFETECEKVLKRHPHGERYPDGYTRELLQAYDEIGEEAIESGAEDGVLVLKKALANLVGQIKKRLFETDLVATAYRRLQEGIHGIAEAPDIVEARAALVVWAQERQAWLKKQLAPRKRLFNKFSVLLEIRTGGMSKGYKVEDSDGRICFLKVADKHSVDVQALRREMEIYDRLSRHGIEGVLDILDCDQTETEAYIALPWADGGTLDAIVPDRGLDIEEAQRLGLWVGEVVSRLHGANIVHRDIKPANILRRGDAWALCDFGLAKNLLRYDQRGTMRGQATPGYAPPEQVGGAEPDRSMDVYAVGKLLCYLATGQTDRDKAFGFAHFNATSLYNLTMDCTRDDPASRPTIAQVVERLTSA